MRIVFMGTPELARVCLEAVLRHPAAEVVAVFTQVDKPKGRGMKMIPSPVKELAAERGIPVYQPTTFKNEACLELLRELDPELIVVAAYGKILPRYVLDYPKYGCMNAHGSLLPKYRGAAPIQWAVLNGDTRTGVTIMQLNEGMDTGDILMVSPVDIAPEETSGELFDRVSAQGAATLLQCLQAIQAGAVTPTAQNEAEATLAPPLTKEMAQFRFDWTAEKIHNWVRGMNPWPGAWFVTSGGKKLKVMECRAVEAHGEAPGTVLATKPLTVACGEGAVQLLNVVPEGKKPMDGTAFAAGQRLKTGDIL